MLDELFFGELNPYADNYKENPDISAAMEKVLRLENELREKLPEADWEELALFSMAHSELSEALATQAFRTGYYIASGIAYDLFQEHRQFIPHRGQSNQRASPV